MKREILADGKFKVVAVSRDGECPALDFLTDQRSYADTRSLLLKMLKEVAERGFGHIPAGWCHEVDKRNGIYEFIKGDLRLFYFKGKNGEIAVCTGGVVKKGQKVNKAAVADAIKWKDEYVAWVKSSEGKERK